MLVSAVEHYRQQQAITAAALVRLRRLRFGPLDRLVATMAAYQVAAARESVRYFPLMLAEQDISADVAAQAIPEALAGSASDGRQMSGLLDYTRSRSVTDQAFALIVATQLQDVARQAASIAMGARPTVQGYVRMLNPPSCSRCAILAGRFYRRNEGFQRHPKCDCRHVPTTNANAGDLTTEPRDYFDSLTEAEQDRIFTKSGAEAIRLGADPAKVVNARRGMTTSQPRIEVEYVERELVVAGKVAGRSFDPVEVRVEPTSRRLIRDEDGLFTTEEGTLRRGTSRRLMPESILEIAGTDRTEAIRLLKANGYLV